MPGVLKETPVPKTVPTFSIEDLELCINEMLGLIGIDEIDLGDGTKCGWLERLEDDLFRLGLRPLLLKPHLLDPPSCDFIGFIKSKKGDIVPAWMSSTEILYYCGEREDLDQQPVIQVLMIVPDQLKTFVEHTTEDVTSSSEDALNIAAVALAKCSCLDNYLGDYDSLYAYRPNLDCPTGTWKKKSKSNDMDKCRDCWLNWLEEESR